MLNLLQEQLEKQQIKTVFGKYVNPLIIKKLLENSTELNLGGQRKEVIVLFSDIRGFTSLSEKISTEEVVEILNQYFEEMVEIIFKYGGTLDKYIGDAIMAIYNAPVNYPDHPARAVRTALAMVQQLKKLERWFKDGKNPINIGYWYGINTGEVVVGNIGTHKRMDYTVIGDNVNIDSRLESLNKKYNSQIIISETTYEKVKDIVDVKLLAQEEIRGRVQPLKIYQVLNLR